MIKSINHTGVVVQNLDRSIAFYSGTVGLEVITHLDALGDTVSQVVGYDNTHLKVALLRSMNGQVIELVQYLQPQPGQRPTEQRAVLGVSHLAFDVDNIDETLCHLVDHGAIKMNDPVEVAPGKKVCYLQDPDGNWLELIEDQSGL